jgi:hypothetical protein
LAGRSKTATEMGRSFQAGSPAVTDGTPAIFQRSPHIPKFLCSLKAALLRCGAGFQSCAVAVHHNQPPLPG